MTILEFVKQNFLISSVSGGVKLSMSYGFMFFSLVAYLAYMKIRSLIAKKHNS